MAEVTHVTIVLDQVMIQTVRMALSSMQLAATQVEVHLNKAVQLAIDAAAKPAAEAPKQPRHLKTVTPAPDAPEDE